MTRTRAGMSAQIHGPTLRLLRTQAGLTISQLARTAGVSTGFLSRVELGVKRAVSEDVFRVLVAELELADPRVLLVNPYTGKVAQITGTSEAPSGPTVVPSERTDSKSQVA